LPGPPFLSGLSPFTRAGSSRFLPSYWHKGCFWIRGGPLARRREVVTVLPGLLSFLHPCIFFFDQVFGSAADPARFLFAFLRTACSSNCGSPVQSPSPTFKLSRPSLGVFPCLRSQLRFHRPSSLPSSREVFAIERTTHANPSFMHGQFSS